ncbi:MAG: tRNA (adenosine(37)-N6)-threonylcarbamoyltransferase complex transferase subunit TsaD, partial [Chloroflexi bacterium]|nr:tRNA (adenosine(37)-N6)-threonylcarbamoyltransferase complex transferase subunit TsaD [Chloroflexota bacterium]
SGLKTALLRLDEAGQVPDKEDAAASFQEAVVDVLVTKTAAAAREYGARHVLLAGGVAANRRLRQRIVETSPVTVMAPPLVLCTDNAAMVAACGYFHFQAGWRDDLSMDVVPGLKLV